MLNDGSNLNDFKELDDFKEAALELINHYINETKEIHSLPINSLNQNQNKPSYLKTSLPKKGLGLSSAVKIFKQKVASQFVQNYHPRFFNWVVGGRTPASILGDFYTSIYDQIVMLCGYGVSVNLENQTIEWLKELFNLPEDKFCGVFTTGATEANLCALATARQWYGEGFGVNISQNGLYEICSPKIIAGLPHSSIDKSLQILGLGRASLIKITHNHTKLDLVSLEKMLQAHKNVIVVANCGEVNTGQSDDLISIGKLCHKYNAWFHVDAAFGLFSRCDESTKSLSEGIEQADSITCDGHKLGNVPYACGFFFLKKTRYKYLTQTFSTIAPYLSEHCDHPMNTRVANSQRLLALPLWFSLLAYGKKGYQNMIRKQCHFSTLLGEWIDKQDNYELLMPVSFNIVLFRHKRVSSVKENQMLIAKICATKIISLSGTVFDQKPALRIAAANWAIDSHDDLPAVCEALLLGAKNFLND